MSRLFPVMCILFVSINSVQAIECQTSVQDGNSYWAWRLIDGRQCWYKGAGGMDKSLLHWSAATDSSDMHGDTPDKPKSEKTQAMSEAQPISPERSKMLPLIPPQPTFEDRWKLR
jgi:hypothetical protein